MAKLKVWKFFSVVMVVMLIAALGAAIVPASPVKAHPGTIQVDVNDPGCVAAPQGDPYSVTYCSIQDAIDDATAGDTVNVAAGVYQQDLTINKELTLQGAGKTTTTINRNTETNQVVLVQADNVKIDGFKIDGGAAHLCSNIVKLSTAGSPPYENIEITNCHILHSANSAVSLTGKDNVSVGSGYKVNDNIIEYFADGSGQAGVYVNFALDAEVKRNTITNSNPSSYLYGGTGVYFFDYSGGTISNNTFSKCYGTIMVNSNVEETYIHDNAISQCRYGVLEVEAFAKIHITNNTITTAQIKTPPDYHNEKGIVLGGDGDWYDSCPPYDWQVDNLQHEVSGNTITGTYKGGEGSIGIVVQPGMIDRDYGASGTVTGNTISNYDNGLIVYGKGGGVDLTSHVHASFSFNNITGCTTDGAVSDWTGAAESISAQNNWWGSNTGPANISDRYDYDPWLQLNISANPTSIAASPTDSSVITASKTQNSDGQDTSGQGHIPDGTEVALATDRGSIGSLTTTKTTTNGVATATLTGESNTEDVVATVSATLNSATVSTGVTFIAMEGPVEDSKSETITGSSGGISAGESPTGGTVTVSGSGMNTVVTTAKYESNPGGSPGFQASGNYYDVHLSNSANVTSLTVDFCPATASTVIYYWNGTSWVAASNQAFVGGCIRVTITADTTPSLSDLTGTPFASGIPPTPTPAPRRVSPTMPRAQQLPPAMTLQYLAVNPQQTYAGEPVTITTNVSNTGGATGSYTVVLMINGQQEATKLVSVGAQSALPVKFTATKDVPGTYTVTIGSQQASFTVLDASSSAGSPISGGLIAITLVGLLVLATAVGLMLALRRRPL